MAITAGINGWDRTLGGDGSVLWVLRDVPGVTSRHARGKDFDARHGAGHRRIEPVRVNGAPQHPAFSGGLVFEFQSSENAHESSNFRGASRRLGRSDRTL